MQQPNHRDAHHENDSVNEPPREVTFGSLIQSVCAAFFGVQSEANRRRDFASGKFWHFVIAGVLFVLILLGVVWGAVQILLVTAS